MNLDLVNQSSADSYLDCGQIFFFLTQNNMLDILLIYLGINFMGVF